MPPVIAALAAELVAIGVGASTAATIATIVVDVGLTLAISGIGMLVSALNRPSVAEQKQVIRQATAPRVKAYGTAKLGGVWAFLKAKDSYLYQLIAICQGPIDSFVSHHFNDEILTLDGSGNVTVPTRFQRSGVNYAQVVPQLGTTTQTAQPILVSDFSGWWTSDYKGQGVANTLVRLLSPPADRFAVIYPTGLPVYNAVIRASLVWHPATEDYDDPSTWSWTENPALIILDAMTSQDGLRLPIDLITPAIDVWNSQIAYCNTTRDLLDDGSEPWYRLGGAYKLTDPPKTWLRKMLDPIDGRLGLRGDGAIVLDVGKWVHPTLTITDDQIVGYSGLSRGRPRADIRNQINATFVSPDYQFVEQQMDPWLNEDSVDTDGLQTLDLDLTWCPSHPQARYRAKIELFRQDPSGWCGTIITNAYGLKYLTPNDDGTKRRNINFQIAELGIDMAFEVSGFSFDHKTGRCTFTGQEMSAEAFDWNPDTDQGTAPALPGESEGDDPVENPADLNVDVEDDNSLSASVDEPVQPSLVLILDYRIHDDGVTDDDAIWHNFTVSGWMGVTAVLPANTYDVRARFRDPHGNYSDALFERGVVVS